MTQASASTPRAVRKQATELLDPMVQLAVDLALAQKAIQVAVDERLAAERAEQDRRDSYAELYQRCRAANWPAAHLRQLGCEPPGAQGNGRRARPAAGDERPSARGGVSGDQRQAPAEQDDAARA